MFFPHRPCCSQIRPLPRCGSLSTSWNYAIHTAHLAFEALILIYSESPPSSQRFQPSSSHMGKCAGFSSSVPWSQGLAREWAAVGKQLDILDSADESWHREANSELPGGALVFPLWWVTRCSHGMSTVWVIFPTVLHVALPLGCRAVYPNQTQVLPRKSCHITHIRFPGTWTDGSILIRVAEPCLAAQCHAFRACFHPSYSPRSRMVFLDSVVFTEGGVEELN
ncbi:uncharacterized protein BCR38DRAFT_143176 [Pseudomassariella vexata]|uniref:Uncharacterized protein n=1 Tax=Pseudomassariella vexata TaxID=1141098 RepID=A0A1Y2EBW8_9PEZI|nr:uncharacterized protein BCR38DRAFT_143176 [Pseudomassariella vexata]ORY69051.1 hypothetical protein BCR38DRAFT_143176 [Pseudomassariella vexata]